MPEPEVTPVVTPEVPTNGAAEPKVEPPKEAKPSELVSDKFAALAKKDKMVSKRAQEVSELEKTIKEREAKIQSESARLEAIRKTASLNPIEAMKELGLTYEQVTEFILNKEKPTPDAKVEALRQEVEDIRKTAQAEREKLKAEAEELTKKQSQQVVDNFKATIGDFVKKNAEKYELIQKLDERGLINAKELIFRGIEMVHQDKGVFPTIEEATEGVQTYLLTELEAVIANVKHFKDKAVVKTPEGATPTSTITNSMNSGIATNLPAATEEDRIRRAIAAMDATG
jgi:F0F1-type ATP synthase membrane subunit b/b'